MVSKKKEWSYINKETGKWEANYVSLDELDALFSDGTIESHTMVINTTLAHSSPRATGIRYSSIARINVDFVPEVETFYARRRGKPITILSGPNNGGKTLLLKQIFALVGPGGYLVACNRFSHVDVLNTRQRGEHDHRQYFESFINSYQTSHQNTEDNELKLEHVVTGLKDREREKLFEVAGMLLGNTFSLKRTDPENTFSPFYVDMDGENLRYGSSGTRLLITLLGIIMDSRFRVLLIDEPEIGLSPRIQAFLGRFLCDAEQRAQHLPHLEQLYIATHSHMLLDRSDLWNNHVVSKVGKVISVRQVESVGEFHQLQFTMLGNELESMFLPSAIIIVEGESDATFVGRVLQLHLPGVNVAIVRADGEGGTLSRLNFFKEAFGDLATSPYRERLFVLLDKSISTRLPRVEKQGVPRGNVVLLSRNGIEYYYPPEILATAFMSNASEVVKWQLEADPLEFNGIRKTKKELAILVSARITAATEMHAEITDLVAKVKAVCI